MSPTRRPRLRLRRSSTQKLFLNNTETAHWDKDHYDVNNGLATKIKVCLDSFGNQVRCTSGSLP